MQVKKKILAITDFTKSSKDAMLFVAKLLSQDGKESTGLSLEFKLLHVFENPDEKSSLLISVKDIVSKDSQTLLNRQSEEISSAFESNLDSGLISISTHSEMGKLKKAVSDIVQSDKIDLIVAGIKPSHQISDTLLQSPVLFMRQNRLPILLVPENNTHKEVKNTLIVNLDASQPKNILYNEFEYIISHNHISKHLINANEHAKALKTTRVQTSIHNMLHKSNIDLLIINPAPGDNIDRAMLDYRIHELYRLTEELLKK